MSLMIKDGSAPDAHALLILLPATNSQSMKDRLHDF
jgi:hypothetical protein